MVTNVKANELVQSLGHKPFPSGTRFIVLDNEANEEMIVTPGRDVYYLKSTDDGDLLEFRSM